MWPRRATLSTDRSTLISVLTPSSPHKDHVPGGRDLVLRQQSPFSPLPTRERALCRCAFHSVSEILPPQGIYHALSLNAKSPPHGGGCWVLGACPGPGGGRPSPLCPGRHSKQPCTVCQKTGSWQVSRVAAPPPPGGAALPQPAGARQHPVALGRSSQTDFHGQGPASTRRPRLVQSKGSPELQTAKQNGNRNGAAQPPLTRNSGAAVGLSLALRALSPPPAFQSKGRLPSKRAS